MKKIAIRKEVDTDYSELFSLIAEGYFIDNIELVKDGSDNESIVYTLS